jgi:hypothetical protein
MAERPRRSLKHSLLSGLIVLAILWVTRGYWSGQGFTYLVIAALVAGIMGEFAATFLMRQLNPPKDPEE